jgi:flagellar basal-body rod protein FlgB
VLDDVTSVALHSAMRGLAARQRTIADNIANINTPGFLAGRVNFEDSLKGALSDGSSPDVAPTVARSLEPTREDGNNVNLDAETLYNVDAGLRYQLMTRAMDNEISVVRDSLRTS